MGDPTLKTLLTAGNALLQPPEPLPSAPTALVTRLKASGELVPWRDRPGWSDDDELEEIGDDDAEADLMKRKARRDALVQLVGQRSLDLVVAMQAFLGKEFWPPEYKDGLGEKDFLLGTADQRLVRLLIQHALVSYLLPLVLGYVGSLRSRAAGDPRLPEVIATFLSLAHTPAPPTGSSSSSSTTRIPHTNITQTVLSSHLPPLLLASITVGWTPTAPPATYASVRTQLLHTLSTLSPTQAIGALSTALKIVQAGKRKAPRGWARTWPSYVEGTLGTLLSNQVIRPGGVRGVMENVFGEAGNMAMEAVDGPKLDTIAGLLSRVPRNSSPETYIPFLLEALFGLIAPESQNHPMVYTHTAVYVVHHMWTASPIAVEWLKHYLHDPWHPAHPDEGVVVPSDRVMASAKTVAQLVLQAPPSPEFTDFVVGPILPQIFALHALLAPEHQPKIIAKKAEVVPGLAADIKLLLTSWGKVVTKDDGVKGVWSIVTGGRGWPMSEDGQVLHWQRTSDGAELVYSNPSLAEVPQAPQVKIEAMDIDDVDQDMLGQFDISPSPAMLARLLKEFERADVSSEVFLKVLDEWRVRAQHEDQDPLQSLLFLRLTLAMMDVLGDKILSNPEHVLSFVEGVLDDEVASISKRKDSRSLIEEVVSEDAHPEEPLPELTAEGVEKMGLVETAISLLLATLEANEKLNHATAAILHPISAHLEALSSSPSSNVRQLAREASMVMLVRRSASLFSSDGQVSEAVATYRRALTLISDPILPVRAHGLVLLRDLPSSKDYDPALTPSIMQVYMGAIMDKDSYIYLNAVKGLAALADALGKDVFKSLVRLYRGDGELEGDKLDKSLRVGEVLGMVIRRAGKAFAANASIVVPTLLAIFRDANLPTILRTSALSLLSTGAEVDHLALLPWSNELASGAVDLIQIESVASSPFRPTPPVESETKAKPKVMLIDDDEPEPEEEAAPEAPRIVDEDPTAKDSKHPALRRAAVVFLGLLAASVIEAASEGEGQAEGGDEFKMRLPGQLVAPTPKKADVGLDKRTLGRAGTVLRYVAGTDDDEVVRGQAAEVVALVERLKTLEGTQVLSRAAGSQGIQTGVSGRREFLA